MDIANAFRKKSSYYSTIVEIGDKINKNMYYSG